MTCSQCSLETECLILLINKDTAINNRMNNNNRELDNNNLLFIKAPQQDRINKEIPKTNLR